MANLKWKKLSSIENGTIKVNTLSYGKQCWNISVLCSLLPHTHTHTHTHSQWPPHGNKVRGNVTASPPMESLWWDLWVPLSLEWALGSGEKWQWWVTWENWGLSGRHGYQESLWVSHDPDGCLASDPLWLKHVGRYMSGHAYQLDARCPCKLMKCTLIWWSLGT